MCVSPSAVEQDRLLLEELGLGQDALVLELGELLEALDGIDGRGRRLGGRGVLLLLCGGLLIFLLCPALALPAADAVGDGGRGACDGGGASDAAKESWHGGLSLS